MEHLAARLDAVYEKASKGVQADVSASEAELAVIHTYLFLAEMARIWLGRPLTSPEPDLSSNRPIAWQPPRNPFTAVVPGSSTTVPVPVPYAGIFNCAASPFAPASEPKAPPRS